MRAPHLPPIVADRPTGSLVRILSDPDVGDVEFINAAAAQAFLEGLVVSAPRHRRLWGWRVLQGGREAG